MYPHYAEFQMRLLHSLLLTTVPEFLLHSALSGLKTPIQSYGRKHRYNSEPKFKLFQNLRLETLDLISWL